jgi:hypothetical protein
MPVSCYVTPLAVDQRLVSDARYRSSVGVPRANRRSRTTCRANASSSPRAGQLPVLRIGGTVEAGRGHLETFEVIPRQ